MVNIMRDTQKKLILMDCKIMLRKLGDIPFESSYEMLQNDLWNIGNKYGVTGVEVFKLLMESFPRKGNKDEKK